jgi:hypothetical protein
VRRCSTTLLSTLETCTAGEAVASTVHVKVALPAPYGMRRLQVPAAQLYHITNCCLCVCAMCMCACACAQPSGVRHGLCLLCHRADGLCAPAHLRRGAYTRKACSTSFGSKWRCCVGTLQRMQTHVSEYRALKVQSHVSEYRCCVCDGRHAMRCGPSVGECARHIGLLLHATPACL